VAAKIWGFIVLTELYQPETF
jgi:hypothetical protein